MSEHFPRQFGKYVLLKSLARGGMGEIYLAASGQTGGLNKLCVIKKVIADKTDRAKVNRFLDEAKVVLRLSHANLVSTFDAGDVGGELFIAMELVEGKDLREIWNRCVRTRTRIPVDVALVVVREIARALAYVHAYAELRLVHRDVAPPNIMLSYFGEVKLTDFGLARSVLKQEHTAPGVVFGRASYLAPEQARGEVADARTDVYSLGIVLWELLTGQPFLQLAGLDPVTSLSLVRYPKTQPPSLRAPWIVAELDAVVLKALAADRDVRFQSAEDLRRALADVMTRVAPRADSERVAEFLRGLYRDLVAEESAERELLLAKTIPLFRGETVPEEGTPRTGVIALYPDALQDPADGGEPPSVEAPGDDPTAVGPPPSGAAVLEIAEAPKESLHVSAMRARADSHGSRPPFEATGVDGPTKVWRKRRGTRGVDAAQTFVGRVIDSRYRIRHRIGEGGMGTVYAAEHIEIGKSVAVKILHRIFLAEEQLVERFRREARAASRVGHPHIVEVTDFGTTEEGCAYFVMELLEGLDLADVLVAEGRLESARAVRIAIQICQALEAAHTAGIIHRDLKPENVFLVAREGQADFVKVLDFGIARNLSDESRRLTNPGMAMGTPEYMAPEQSQGKPAERRTDVYALGALLHEMVMGLAPFQADSPQDMLEAKRLPLNSLRRARPEIPSALDAIVLRALSPDPERRPQTMKQLEYELAKIAWGRPQAVAQLLGLQEGAEHLLSGPGAAAGIDRDERNQRAEADLSISPSGDGAARLPGAASSDEDHGPPTPSPIDGRGEAHGLPDISLPLVASIPPPDWERLLEADLSPAPRTLEPLPGLAPPASSAGSPHFVATVVQQPVPPRVQGAPPRPSLIGPRVGTPIGTPAVALGVGVNVNLTAAAANPRHQSRGGRRAAAFVLLAVIGGAAAWTATNGPPEFARAFLKAWRPRGAGPKTTRTAVAVAPPTSRSSDVGRAPPLPAGTTSSILVASSTPADPSTPRGAPEIVQTPPIERARTAMVAGTPDDAVAVLRPVVARGNGEAKPLLADALVASGWNDVKVYRWGNASHKAREALSLMAPSGPSHGAHALLGEALYAQGDFTAALAEFTKALAESPRDARLKRRVIRSRRQLHHPPGADPKGESESPADETAAEQQ